MLSRKKKLEIPVYLFMGFLEAGKTTFIPVSYTHLRKTKENLDKRKIVIYYEP